MQILKNSYVQVHKGGPRTATTSKMERFVIIFNGFRRLNIITKYVAAVLDPPLVHIKKVASLLFRILELFTHGGCIFFRSLAIF